MTGRVPLPPAGPPPEAVSPLPPAPAPAGGRPDWPAPAEGKSPPDPIDHSVTHRPAPVVPLPVVTVEPEAAESSWVTPAFLQLPMVPPAVPPMTPPGQPGPVQPPANGGGPPPQPPRPLPPSDPGPGGQGGPTWKPAGPHVRAFPTAAGARLNLAPYEVPADRVVELTRQLEAAAAVHQELQSRIRELEGLGVGREQALAEAFREAEAAAAEVARTREQLRAMSAEIATLRAKLRQLEEEDVATLRAVIAALDRLLPPGRRD
ncbi:MAG: hypothetical protein C0501_16620 [Isosphaera sp.]|nr:hypothetical protein [Isosphaera sp.]